MREREGENNAFDRDSQGADVLHLEARLLQEPDERLLGGVAVLLLRQEVPLTDELSATVGRVMS